MTLIQNHSRFRSKMLLWLALGTGCLLVMLTHQSTPVEYFGRYSQRYVLLLAFVLVTVLIAATLFILARTQRFSAPTIQLPTTRAFGWLVVIVTWIMLGALWLTVQPSSRNVPGIAAFRIYLLGLAFVVGLTILTLSGTAHLHLSRRWTLAVLLITPLLIAVLLRLYLDKIGFSNYFDEAYLLNWGWSVPQTGKLAMLPALPPAHIAEGQVPLLLSGLWMDLTGIGVAQARLFYLLFAWLSVPFIFLTTRRLYGYTAALLAAIIAALVPLSHIYIRTDSVVALTLALGLYFYFSARASGSLWRHFLAGLAIAFTMEGNYYGVRYALALGFLYLIDFFSVLRQERRWRWNAPIWPFALGGLAYVVFFIVVHVMRVPGGTFGYMLQQYSTETQIHAYVDPLYRLLQENFVFYRDYLGNHSLEVLLLVGGIVGAVIRRKGADPRLLFILLASRILLTVALAHENPAYWIGELPFIAILGRACLAQLAGRLDSAPTDSLNLAGLLAAISVVVVFAANMALVPDESSLDPVVVTARKIDQILPPEMGVIAPNPYYLGMPLRKNFMSDDLFEYGTPEQWVKEPPQAAIITIGLEHSKRPGLLAYIARNSRTPAYCFEHGYLGYPAIVYIARAQLPQSAPVNCNAALLKAAP